MLNEDICEVCNVPAKLACKCEDRYRFFCFDHLATHLKESSTKHTLADLSEAKNDTQLEKRRTLLNSIQKEFEDYKEKVLDLRDSYENSQNSLEGILSSIFIDKKKSLTHLALEVDLTLNKIAELSNSSQTEAEAFIESFNSKGVQMLKNYDSLEPVNLRSIITQVCKQLGLELQAHQDDSIHKILETCQLSLRNKEAEEQKLKNRIAELELHIRSIQAPPSAGGNEDLKRSYNKLQVEERRLRTLIKDLQSQNKALQDELQLKSRKSEEEYERSIQLHKEEDIRNKNAIFELQKECKLLSEKLEALLSNKSSLQDHRVYSPPHNHTNYSPTPDHTNYSPVPNRRIYSPTPDTRDYSPLQHLNSYSEGPTHLQHTLTGHTEYVLSVYISLDNRFIISGSYDKSVRVWNFATKSLEAVLNGHTNYVSSVCMTGDSRYVISGSRDKSIIIWNLATRSIETVLTGHSEYIISICMSHDSDFIISASGDKTIRIWSFANRSQIAVLTGHTGIVNTIAISLNGKYIVSGSGDSTAIIWNFATKSKEAVLSGHSDYIRSLCISNDSRYIITAGGDKTVRIWNFETKEQEAVLSGHTAPVYSVSISSDGRYLVSGSWDKSIRIWNMKNRAVEEVLSGHASEIWSLAVSRDNQFIVSGSCDRTVRVWSFTKI